MKTDEVYTGILNVAHAPGSSDFEKLVRLSGLDPQTDFIDADLAGVDLRHVDLSSYNLTGARVSQGALPKAYDSTGVVFVDIPFIPRNRTTSRRTIKWMARIIKRCWH